MLSRFERDQFELIIDQNTGDVFYPGYRSLARVASIGLKTEVQPIQVRRVLESEGVTKESLQEAEIQTTGGMQAVTLIPRRVGSKVIKKYNPDLWDEMGECGHLVFLHQLAGYEVKTIKPENELTAQPKTSAEMLLLFAQQMVEQERRLLALEQAREEVSDRLAAVEAEQDRFSVPCGHKYSILGYAKMQGLQISCAQASAKGRKASAICRREGIQVERIHDPRFGKVGLYPEAVLLEVFA